jgi:hypothetical protein
VGSALAAARAQSLAGVSIYPVPAQAGRFTVALGGAAGVGGSTVVEVLNAQGQAVYQQQFGPQQTTLAVETGLSAGIYLVRIHREGGIFTQKVSVF